MYKILLTGLYYPFAMLTYFRRALERRNDIELITCGAFTGQDIPWAGGMKIPMKYYNTVDIPLPPNITLPPWELVSSKLPWKPDLVLNIDAGFHFSTKPDVPYAIVGTDPHVLDGWYAPAKKQADWFFNMQFSYMEAGDIYLPYCFDPKAHYPDTNVQKVYDAALIGLHYDNRNHLVTHLRELGLSVNYGIGQIFDEYRFENNSARIGINWSSRMDVTARVFEIMAMRMIPVFNRLPGLDALGMVEGEHYLGFSSLGEAVEKVVWAKNNPSYANEIADIAYQWVWSNNHTYDSRVQTILETCLKI